MAPITWAVIWSCSSKMSAKLAVEAIRPKMRTVRRFDELAGDAQTVAGLAHASFQDIAHTELAPNLAHVDRAALVGEGRVARDHEQRLAARQAGDDVLDQAVDEVLLLGIAAHVLKGQHGNRWLVGKRQSGMSVGRGDGHSRIRCGEPSSQPHPIRPERRGSAARYSSARVHPARANVGLEPASRPLRAWRARRRSHRAALRPPAGRRRSRHRRRGRRLPRSGRQDAGQSGTRCGVWVDRGWLRPWPAGTQ